MRVYLTTDEQIAEEDKLTPEQFEERLMNIRRLARKDLKEIEKKLTLLKKDNDQSSLRPPTIEELREVYNNDPAWDKMLKELNGKHHTKTNNQA